jgi:hypothetical protein
MQHGWINASFGAPRLRMAAAKLRQCLDRPTGDTRRGGNRQGACPRGQRFVG